MVGEDIKIGIKSDGFLRYLTYAVLSQSLSSFGVSEYLGLNTQGMLKYPTEIIYVGSAKHVLQKHVTLFIVTSTLISWPRAP